MFSPNNKEGRSKKTSSNNNNVLSSYYYHQHNHKNVKKKAIDTNDYAGAQRRWCKLKTYEKVAAMTALGQMGGIVVSGLEIDKHFREWTGFEGGTIVSVEPLFLCDIDDPIPTPFQLMYDLKERLEKC